MLQTMQNRANALPQRIRAGCDPSQCNRHGNVFLCLSAFARVATRSPSQLLLACLLCHSAFARVATQVTLPTISCQSFATAHSRGLRRCWKPSLTATRFFATAHSRGLRRSKTKSSTTLCCFATAHSRGLRPSWRNNPIPSRLLCHSAFARVATVVYCVCCRYCAIFATAHSRGLRLMQSLSLPPL